MSFQRSHIAVAGSRKCPLPLCPPGLSSLTHLGCCWLISGHPSPAPSGQPNASSAENQPLEPGEAPGQLSEPKQVVPQGDGKGKWSSRVPGKLPNFRQHFSFLTQCLKVHIRFTWRG